MKYDKQVCLNNIRFLAKEKGINLGELETGAGVSAGYLSRIGKEDNKSNPGIEVLSYMAEKLGVSVDGLISNDYSDMTPSEKYIYAFIEKLMHETLHGNQSWEKEAPAVFARLETYGGGQTSHPLFAYDDGDICYNSYFSPANGAIPAGEFFNTKIKDNCYLYIASVNYPSHKSTPYGTDRKFYEVYIVEYSQYRQGSDVEPLCATSPATSTGFDTVLEQLYVTAKDSCRNVKVNDNVRRMIDAYMNPPEEDDELPF